MLVQLVAGNLLFANKTRRRTRFATAAAAAAATTIAASSFLVSTGGPLLPSSRYSCRHCLLFVRGFVVVPPSHRPPQLRPTSFSSSYFSAPRTAAAKRLVPEVVPSNSFLAARRSRGDGGTTSSCAAATGTDTTTVRSMSHHITNPNPVVHCCPTNEGDGGDSSSSVLPPLLPPWMMKERTRVLSDDEDGASSLIDEYCSKKKAKASSSSSSSSDGSTSSSSCVAYWMQRDVRTSDNMALSWASHLASRRGVPLKVVYALTPPPPQAAATAGDDGNFVPPDLVDMPMTARHADFLLGGLECVHSELKARNVPLHVVRAESHSDVGEAVCRTLIDKHRAEFVVVDFSPLRQYREWIEVQAQPVLQQAGVPFVQVDAHNVVPVWVATDKREVGARTLRPRIHRVVSDYLRSVAPPPDDERYAVGAGNAGTELVLPDFDREACEEYLQIDDSVPPVRSWAKPGTEAGMEQMRFFFKHGLKRYDDKRNDPNESKVCSNLSPWINHGHVSFQRVAIEVKKLNRYANATASFIEEGLVRRELSDNYVYYSPNDYDRLSAAAGWAQETLNVHSSDEREYLYTTRELERGETHDDLWNAAQLQLVREGGMHGFLRMYWAKKILEWTESPEVALRTAQYFNDWYALDGRDPNGFVGVGWSIMGIHDQGWKERPVFGKIRFMNYNGCKRKFKVPDFVSKYKGASENAAKSTDMSQKKKAAGSEKAGKKRKR